MNAQHGFQWVWFSASTGLGVERLDQLQRPCPRHDLIHLGEEAFGCVSAFTGVLGIGEGHLFHEAQPFGFYEVRISPGRDVFFRVSLEGVDKIN